MQVLVIRTDFITGKTTQSIDEVDALTYDAVYDYLDHTVSLSPADVDEVSEFKSDTFHTITVEAVGVAWTFIRKE